ncbi:MAG: tetratricopeptide repeat protein, partial [Terriglobales bacterium]
MLLAPPAGVQAGDATPLAVGQSSTRKPSAGKSGPALSQKAKPKHPATAAPTVSPRVARVKETFLVSTDLKPMASQLLNTRSAEAYAGVEAYAERHDQDSAGALAWLVVGYARLKDGERPQAIEALKRAQPKAGELGDYVDFLLASAYRETGDNRGAILALKDFDSRYPDSLLRPEALLLYADTLQAEGRVAAAIALLESQAEPRTADVEMALARAFLKTAK